MTRVLLVKNQWNGREQNKKYRIGPKRNIEKDATDSRQNLQKWKPKAGYHNVYANDRNKYDEHKCWQRRLDICFSASHLTSQRVIFSYRLESGNDHVKP